MTQVTPQLAREAWGSLETLHVVAFFAPEVQAAYDAMGVRGARAGYFAARASALGPVGPAPVVATFYVFAPSLVERVVPRVWAAAAPERWAAARVDGVRTALHGALGEPDVAEALELARQACAGLTAAGRPLYAAWRSVDEPDEPLLQLWHAALLVREHRGDGHVSALLAAGLDPVESLITGGLATNSTEFVRTTRGWTDEEWAAGVQRCRDRGLVDDGGLTDAGAELRRRVEETTDALATEGWAHLGADGTQRLVELLAPLRRRVFETGVLPDWIRARS
ncbi:MULTISPECIES: SCO6745 family protein [unclassified Modestobacter]